jgi:AcrR family transcriptional regulator
MGDLTQVRSTFLTNPTEQVIEVAAGHSASGFLSRQHVIEAAASCFAERGYDGTTVRAIAARLGCSVGSIYRYFSDKRHLLCACAEHALGPAVEACRAPGATLERAVAGYVDCAVTHDELYRLMFFLSVAVEHSAHRPRRISQIIDGWAPLIGGSTAAERCWALVHGGLMLGQPPQEIVGQVVAEFAHQHTSMLDRPPAAVPPADHQTAEAPVDAQQAVAESPPAPPRDDVTLL